MCGDCTRPPQVALANDRNGWKAVISCVGGTQGFRVLNAPALAQYSNPWQPRNLCSQASIDCWAKIPAIAPCHEAVVTEGMRGLARSPAA